ncbi:MAG TPA: hypothetical protein DDW78_09110 [Treponema sp.]|nr:hypothetical protein [Treponema sp.]
MSFGMYLKNRSAMWFLKLALWHAAGFPELGESRTATAALGSRRPATAAGTKTHRRFIKTNATGFAADVQAGKPCGRNSRKRGAPTDFWRTG